MAFRSFAVLSLLVSVALADSSNPYIPSGISPSCSKYLASLDSNNAFAACTSPFTSALKQFAPDTNTPSISQSVISSVLGSLCSGSAFSACPQSTLTAELSSFYAACQSELTVGSNPLVKTVYDVLYSMGPIRVSICAKDDGGNYCAAGLNASRTKGNVALVEQGATSSKQDLLGSFLYSTLGGNSPTRRDTSNSTAALVPNTTTYQSTNLLFLFLEPAMSTSQLCTTCTRNILTPYIAFESSSPYGPGMNNSVLLAGQVPLYTSVVKNCPANFLSGAVQAAGGLSSSIANGAAPRLGSQELSAAVGALLGVVAFVAASL